MLASKLLLVMMCFALGSTAQTLNDSLHSEVDIFRSNVKRAVFVRISPVCDTIRRRREGRLFKKKYIECYAESVIMCTHEANTSKKLKREIVNSRLFGHVDVQSNDLDSLLSLLYESEKLSVLNMCYYPRHGILFFDDHSRQLGFVEVCLECNETRTTENVPEVGVINFEDLDRLKGLFTKYGLE